MDLLPELPELYDIEQFDPQPPAECTICLNVFFEPRENACGHVFCESCLEQWVVEGMETCPLCRSNVDLSKLRLAREDLQDAIGQLTLRCNSEGCSVVVSLNHYWSHVLYHCEFLKLPCRWMLCDKMIARRATINTLQSVPLRSRIVRNELRYYPVMPTLSAQGYADGQVTIHLLKVLF